MNFHFLDGLCEELVTFRNIMVPNEAPYEYFNFLKV